MNYKIIDGEKVYGYRWIILALMGLACIVVNGSTLVFAGMAGILLNPTGQWAFDAQQFMMLTSCSYLTGFLFCMVTGTMADRMGSSSSAWRSLQSVPSCASSGAGSPACS